MILIARNKLALSDIMLINLLFVNGWYMSLWQMPQMAETQNGYWPILAGYLDLDGIFRYLWETCTADIGAGASNLPGSVSPW